MVKGASRGKGKGKGKGRGRGGVRQPGYPRNPNCITELVLLAKQDWLHLQPQTTSSPGKIHRTSTEHITETSPKHHQHITKHIVRLGGRDVLVMCW